jgi:anaerobic selenocysteine-containing dehydrogenase
LYNPDRIDRPLLRVGERGKGEFNEIGWSDALARITNQLQILQTQNKQNGFVLITDPLSAHLGDVTERFVSEYGGRHLQYETIERTNISRAMKDVYSQETMPDFDISNSAYILSFGADWLNTWTSPTRYMRAYGEFRQGKNRKRGTLVHVDPRFSATAANADQWIPINPGWEGILALGIANVILSDGLVNDSIRSSLSPDDIAIIDRYTPEKLSLDVGVNADKIRLIAHEFSSHAPALAIGGGSAAAHTNGLFNMKAVYWLNYLVGSVGVEGGVIFNPEPPVPSVGKYSSSFEDFRNLSQEMSRGEISALMIRGADPWYGLPEDSGFRRATFEVPFIFAVSNFLDDTTAMADLILPENDAFEDWGSDIPDPAPGYQLIGFQQPVVRPFYENLGDELGTKNFADIMIGLAPQLGLDLALPGTTFTEILKAGAEDLWRENRGSITAADFDSFWYGVLQRGGWWDKDSKYQGTIPSVSNVPNPKSPKFDHSPSQFPYHLIPFTSTGIGDGEGAFLPWLQATPDPITTATWQTWLEINVYDAEKLEISEGDVISVTSASGKSIDVLAFPHPGVPPGVLSVPIGQGHISGGTPGCGNAKTSIDFPLAEVTLITSPSEISSFSAS